MRSLLTLLFVWIIFVSCTEEKIIYVENANEEINIQGRWEIEGFWQKYTYIKEEYSYLDSTEIISKETFYDTLYTANDIIDFYYDYSSEIRESWPFVFRCSDTTLRLSNYTIYPFFKYISSTTIRQSLTLFDHYIGLENINKNSPSLRLEMMLNHKENSGTIPFIIDNDNCSIKIMYSDDVTNRIDKIRTTVNTTFSFIGTGKRVKEK